MSLKELRIYIQSKVKLGQKQNTVEPHRGQITHFKLSGDMMDEFLSYISMIGKDDYCVGWICNGELIDWEISPVLEGGMQTTDNPGKIHRRWILKKLTSIMPLI